MLITKNTKTLLLHFTATGETHSLTLHMHTPANTLLGERITQEGEMCSQFFPRTKSRFDQRAIHKSTQISSHKSVQTQAGNSLQTSSPFDTIIPEVSLVILILEIAILPKQTNECRMFM